MAQPQSVALRPALFPELPFDLVVIAASSGGVTAVRDVLAALPGSFATPIAIVQHVQPVWPCMLPQVWEARSRLRIEFAQQGGRLRAGTVCVAPPSGHLLLGMDHRFEIAATDKVNYVRPAADVLFESAAIALGPRVLGVVLTGRGRDGARGARMIKERGGTVIAQEPHDSEASSMPEATIEECDVDVVLPLKTIPHGLIALTMNPGTRSLFTARCSL